MDGGKQLRILITFAQQIRHPGGEYFIIFSLSDLYRPLCEKGYQYYINNALVR